MEVLTPKEQRFVDATDSDISNEIWESFIFPEDNLPWFEFYTRYQDKHYEKYGHYLTID